MTNEEFFQAFDGLPLEYLIPIAEKLSPVLWAEMRAQALPDAKNHVNVRFLHNGTEVTTNAGGTTVGLTGGKGQFDIVNFQGGLMDIDSATNARQVNVHVGGGGADCMFTRIVSPCFATQTSFTFTEGMAFTATSGCTFNGYSTVQGAATAAAATHVAESIAICSGTYTENVSFSNGTRQASIRFLGAGVDSTKIVSVNAAGTATMGFGTTTAPNSVIELSNMTLAGSAGQGEEVLENAGGNVLYAHDLLITVPTGHPGGIQCNGNEFLNRIRILGTTAPTRGILISTGCTDTVIDNVYIDTFSESGILFNASSLRNRLSNVHILNCGVGLQGTGGNTSQYSNIHITNCSSAIKPNTGAFDDCVFHGMTITNCPTGLDFTNVLASSGVNSSTFDDIVFITSTPSYHGIDRTAAGAKLNSVKNCIFTGLQFVGYTSGNELFGTGAFASTTEMYHNKSDAGALVDIGNPVGHSGLPIGTSSAPIDAQFLTLAADSNLTNERIFTPRNNLFSTDNGANSTYIVESWRRGADIASANPLVLGSDGDYFHVTGTAGIAGIFASYQQVVLADSPRAYYRMGEASGQPQDSSGNAMHTTVTGGTPTYSVAGAIATDNNTAITLNGTTGYFSAPDNALLDLGDVLTIEAWVKKAADGTLQAIVSKGTNGYYLRINASNFLELLKDNVSSIVSSTVAITGTAYHHVAATKNGSTVHLYIDGVDVTGTVTNATLADTAAVLAIGRRASISSEFFNGTLDEVAVYPTALSATRIAAHYTSGSTVAGARALLKFDGACLLTHSSTFILQGAVNYTTAAGDVLEFISEGSGIWREINRHRNVVETRSIPFVIDGGGSTVTTGIKPSFVVPFACTIVGWDIEGDAAGTCTIDVTTANDAASPSYASIVGAGTKPNIAGPAVCSTLTAPASWTSTAISANQHVQYNVTAVATFKWIVITLKVTVP